MSSFGKISSTFINNSQNPILKFNEISSTIQSLYSNLLNGKIDVPFTDTEFTDLINNVDLTYYNIFTQYSETSIVDGVPTKIGYSPIKIVSSVTNDPLQFIATFDDTYKSELLNLNIMYRRFNKSANDFKLLAHLYDDLMQKYITDFDLTKYSFTTQSFKTVFRTDPYEDGTLSTSQIISIPYIFTYILLYKLYLRSYNFPSSMLIKIYEDNALLDSEFSTQFSTYIESYSDDISGEIADYINTNIFLFGTNVASHVRNTVKESISGLLSTLGTIFSSISSSVVVSNYIYAVNYDILNQLACDSAVYYLNNGFFENIYDYFNTTSDDIGELALSEDTIISNIVTYINQNLNLVSEFKTIAKIYAEKPLFFLNTFLITFSAWTLNFLQDSDVIYLADVQTWLNSFFQTKSTTVSKLLEQVTNNKFHTQNAEHIVKFCNFLRMREIINNFCDSDEFQQFIINKLLPKIDEDLKSKYHLEVEWYKEIDKVITFVRLLFTKHVLDDKLFSQYISQNISYVNDFIISEVEITEQVINNLLLSTLQSSKQHYYVFNSFFKSAAMSKYLQKILLDDYSL